MFYIVALAALVAAPTSPDYVRAPALDGIWLGKAHYIPERSTCTQEICMPSDDKTIRYAFSHGLFMSQRGQLYATQQDAGASYLFEASYAYFMYGMPVDILESDRVFKVDKDHLSVLVERKFRYRWGESCTCVVTQPMSRIGSARQAHRDYTESR